MSVPGRPDDDPVAAPPAAHHPPLWSRRFTAESVTAVRHAVARRVTGAGLTGDPAEDFVLAVHELVANAVRHGGGAGEVTLRLTDDVLTCEVTDQGAGRSGLDVQFPPVDVPGGRGLWLAHQLTGALMLTRRPAGVTATVSMCVTGQPAVRRSAAGGEPSGDADAGASEPPENGQRG